MLFAPINPADLNIVQGAYPTQPTLPAIGGSEGVGQVVEVGPNAKTLKVGDLVLPVGQGFGTWRTYATCPETELFSFNPGEGVPQEYLATLQVNPATAYRLLEDFVKLKEGDVIIQNGANSMVGTCIIQLAAARGIKSINIIRHRSDYAELVEKLKGYGAYMVVDDSYVQKHEFKNLIADLPKPKLALNCVGGDSATQMTRLLAKGGTMVTYGGMAIKPVITPASAFIFNDVNLRGFWLSNWYTEHSLEERKQLLNQLSDLVKSKKLRLWTERHTFGDGFNTALDRAINSSSRNRKVLLKFE